MLGNTKIAELLSICCLLSWATLVVGSDKFYKIVSADIRSIEAGVVTIPATFDNGESSTVYEAKVKGTLVLTDHKKIDVTIPTTQDYKQYASQYAKDNYCSNNLTGMLTFNAGRNISIDIGTGSLSDKAVTVVELMVETLPKTMYGTTKITVRCK